MHSLSRIKSELASRVLYSPIQGKAQERYALEGFLQRIHLDVIKITDMERPDFLIEARNLRVGIELTTLSSDASRRGSKEKQTFSKWKNISERISLRLQREGHGHRSVYGAVFFNAPSDDVLFKLDIELFVEEVIKALGPQPSLFDGQKLRDFDPKTFPILSRHVEHIFIRYFPSELDILWWSSDLQSGPVVMEAASLKTAIEKKTSKANTYVWHDAPERWLLVLAPGLGLKDLFSFEEVLELANPAPFTQVFVWDIFLESIYQTSPNKALVLEKGRSLFVNRLSSSVRNCLVET